MMSKGIGLFCYIDRSLLLWWMMRENPRRLDKTQAKQKNRVCTTASSPWQLFKRLCKSVFLLSFGCACKIMPLRQRLYYSVFTTASLLQCLYCSAFNTASLLQCLYTACNTVPLLQRLDYSVFNTCVFTTVPQNAPRVVSAVPTPLPLPLPP